MSASILTTIFNNLSNLTPLEPPALDDLELELYQPIGARHHHQGPLHNLSEADAEHARSIFLTLHVLFPHELLPALDILDRALVTKLVVKPVPTRPNPGSGLDNVEGPSANVSESEKRSAAKDLSCEIFYVQSAPAAEKATTSKYRSRYSKASTTSTYYEVLLDSWNCSCPAFSVSAFHSLNLEPFSEVGGQAGVRAEVEGPEAEGGRRWEYGGINTLRLGRVPSCKHILAAVLAKAAPELFKNGFKERTVTRQEIVAWGGGWGELGGG